MFAGGHTRGEQEIQVPNLTFMEPGSRNLTRGNNSGGLFSVYHGKDKK